MKSQFLKQKVLVKYNLVLGKVERFLIFKSKVIIFLG